MKETIVCFSCLGKKEEKENCKYCNGTGWTEVEVIGSLVEE